jgi:hypothetical protein
VAILASVWLTQCVGNQYSTWIGGSILAGLGTFKKVSSTRFRTICARYRADPARGCRCGSRQRNTRKIPTSSTASLSRCGRCSPRSLIFYGPRKSIRDRTIFDDLCNDHHDDPSPHVLLHTNYCEMTRDCVNRSLRSDREGCLLRFRFRDKA